MNFRCHLFGGVAGLWVLCGATAVSGQAPRHTVALDFDCLEASLGPLEKITFEDLPEATGCPGGSAGEPLSSPLEISGVVFTDPACFHTSFCPSPICPPDPDGPASGNVVLSLSRGASIEFPDRTGSAILAAVGSDSFTLQATDVLGKSIEATVSAVPFEVTFFAFTSSVGLFRIEISEAGAGGPLALAAVYFGHTPREDLPRDCPDPPPRDLGNVRPRATGTIRFFPELGMFGPAPVGDDIQSTYFKTTEVNREFRRGFVEFAIPDVEGEILASALILRESRGTTGHPMPPDVHQLSYYSADLAVTIEDFDRPTTLLATFETDANLPTAEFAFDVSRVVKEFRGRSLGFEIKLAADPIENRNIWLGSGFGSLWVLTPFLEIITRQLSFRRGDPSADGRVDLSDPITILQSLFGGETGLGCEKSADVDDTGVLDVTDAVYLLQFQFLGGPPPKEPFPFCGNDATPDDLGCAAVPPCP